MSTKNSVSRKGVLAGGNWIIDQVKMIDTFPQRESLANILSQSPGTGGSPYNILVDLAKMGVDFPLAGAGFVGKDPLGTLIIEDSPVGVTGAVASGAHVVGLAVGQHCGPGHEAVLRAAGAPVVVANFDEIAALLASGRIGFTLST